MCTAMLHWSSPREVCQLELPLVCSSRGDLSPAPQAQDSPRRSVELGHRFLCIAALILMAIAVILQPLLVAEMPRVRYHRMLLPEGELDNAIIEIFTRPVFEGLAITEPSDFFRPGLSGFLEELSFVVQYPNGPFRYVFALAVQLFCSLASLFAWEQPSSTSLDIAGLHLPSYCSSCFLLARESTDGFDIPLSIPDTERQRLPSATIHLSKDWTIRSWTVDTRGDSVMASLSSSDVVRLMLTHVINLKLHTLGHMAVTTLAHLAHSNIAPQHQIHTFLTDFLHPWLSVVNDVYGYSVASLARNGGTILSSFQPDMTENYVAWGIRGGCNSSISRSEWEPLANIISLADVAQRLHTYSSSSMYLEASELFVTTVHSFVFELYPNEDAFIADASVGSFLIAVQAHLQPYTSALGIESLIRGSPVKRDDLERVLVFFLHMMLVHSETMARDVFNPDNPLAHWTVYGGGAHHAHEVAMLRMLHSLPEQAHASALVSRAPWPHQDTSQTITEFQMKLKDINDMTFVSY
eukprot:TRINITY_DN107584_c0_g1_i1.p1 TRINITY_DN107584_c0_g1~~TRINITY_DN107584_c0_g1_i1.p1  ORF type:complete len:523 (-),score=50.55 TRINITY_DN107584_c0_g1_i1:268-1836(-)